MYAEGGQTLLVRGVVGVVGTASGVERADGLHLDVRQLEAEDVEVAVSMWRYPAASASRTAS